MRKMFRIFGNTREEALSEFRVAMKLWFDVIKEHGDKIHLPKTVQT